MHPRSRIAVVGGGAAGLAAAYTLQQRHDVTIFERESELGGHVRTVVIPSGPDAGTALDAGFMVLNDAHYPTLHRLLAQLGIDCIGTSDMSFGYYSSDHGFQYAINWRSEDPFARLTNLAAGTLPGGRQSALGQLFGAALGFCRTARRDLHDGYLAGKTLSQYVQDRGFSPELVEHYILPLGSLSWSTPPRVMLDFPAETYVAFFENHGLLTLSAGPRWQYIRNGAVQYVRAIAERFRGAIELGVRDVKVSRDDTGATIHRSGSQARFDFVVIATHADEALGLLLDPSEEERRLLGAWKYRQNRCVLHTDASVMPPDRSAWASWNYESVSCSAGDGCHFSTTYHLNRLQGRLETKNQYFLTLNRRTPIPPEHAISEITFTHPVYTLEAVGTQPRIREQNGTRRTYYCGSYLGFSFHEDAVKSGVAVAEALGLTL
jgi:predicted NAD/FAD-binding protein